MRAPNTSEVITVPVTSLWLPILVSAVFQHSIWYHWRWGTTFVSVFDGLIYALLTAGTFGWLWPS